MSDLKTVETTLSTLATLAPTVGAEYDAEQAAISAERDAEAAILDRAIEIARPALKAASNKIQTSWSSNDLVKSTYLPVAGICVDDDKPGAARNGRWVNGQDQTDGPYEGADLFLGADGVFYLLRYSGNWTLWQGRSSSWEADVTTRTTREVMDSWKLDEVLGYIAKAIEAQAGKRDSKAARERADKLAAILKLI
jgi:hypothetical protein